MSRILLFSGGRSGNNASMTLVKALKDKGHQIIFFDVANEKSYLKGQGFEVHSFPAEGLSKKPMAKKSAIPLFDFFSKIRQQIQNLDIVYSYGEQWLDQNRIDLVLLDSNSLDLAVPILKKKIPIINVSCTLAALSRNGGPPVFSGYLPSKHPTLISKVRSKAAWLPILLPQYLKETVNGIVLRIAFGMRPFEDVKTRIKKYGGRMRRTEYGLRLLAPEIIMGPKCIDYPNSRNVPGKLYANACVYEQRKDVGFNFDQLDKEKPIIYCAVGTCSGNYPHKRNLQRCVVEAMKYLNDYQLVMQGVESGDIDSDYDIPGNAFLGKIIPQLDLLKRARIFITHGGFASIREGVYFGVPMIVFPGWHDQFGNAAKVVYHGIGLRGNMKNVSSSRMVEMIKTIDSSNEIKHAIRRMQQELRKRDEIDASIEFIEAALRKRLANNKS